jgi:hypothetical protein
VNSGPAAVDPAHLDHARRVADAILYEGYLLYPYRGSAQKNQQRFQFGVLMPPAYSEVDSQEPAATQTECILECPDSAELTILARFLHLQRRTVQATSDGQTFTDVGSLRLADVTHTPFDEATEREHRLTAPVGELIDRETDFPFAIAGSESVEELAGDGRIAGRLVRLAAPLHGLIRVKVERLPGPYGALRVRVALENRTQPDAALERRGDGLRFALIATHSLLAVPGGRFLSMTSPPQWASGEVAGCVNIGTWPVLAGPGDCEDLMLSSPVILYDHPEIAAESAGELFDSTEIDEILTLRTLTLTEEEKQEARSTDPRAAELMDRLDNLPPEMFEKMHGAIRYLKPAGREPSVDADFPQLGGPGFDSELGKLGGVTGEPSAPGQAPWWDPGADSSVSPQTDHVVIAGNRVARGSRVRLQPGARRTDAQDLFLIGRIGIVEAVLHDVDGNVHLAVTVADDPAAELQRNHGRFLYFAPDEVEPLAGQS